MAKKNKGKKASKSSSPAPVETKTNSAELPSTETNGENSSTIPPNIEENGTKTTANEPLEVEVAIVKDNSPVPPAEEVLESIEMQSVEINPNEDNVSIKSMDAVLETSKEDLNDLKPETSELTEQELNPDLAKFMSACQDANLTIVKELISTRKVSANDTFSEGITGLHWACINNRLTIVKYLMENEYSQSDPNISGGDLKATPLHWACRNGLVYIVDYLLTQTNADPSLRDSQAYNALHLAVHSSNITLVIYILLTCCDTNSNKKLYIDEPDGYSRTGLHWASYQGDILTVNALLKFGADVSKVDNTLFIPLHWAFMKGYKVVLKTLLEEGSDIFAKNDQGKNTFDIAKDMNCLSTWIKVLKENNRDPKNNWAKNRKFIEPKLGKLITFFTPYILLPIVLQISFRGEYWIPKLFLAVILVFATFQFLNRLIIPTYLIDDKPLPKTPFLSGIFSASAFWAILITLYNLLPILILKNFFAMLLLGACIVIFVWAFFKTMFINPGYVPTPSDNAVILSQVLDLIKIGEFDTDHFCVNTFVRKPLRSRYSRYNKKLIARFDHYCPWVYNEIGVRNHKLFVTFVYALNIAIVLLIYLSIEFFDYYEDKIETDSKCFLLSEELCYGFRHNHFHFNLLVWTTLQCIWVMFLSVVQTFQILKGITTWEFGLLNHKIQRSSRFNHSTVPMDFTAESPAPSSTQPQQSRTSGLKSCMNLIGLDQFIATLQLSFSALLKRSTSTPESRYESLDSFDIPSDYGLKQNWLDFWVLGDLHWRNIFYLPIEGENNLNGHTVDYYKLYELPPKNSGNEIV